MWSLALLLSLATVCVSLTTPELTLLVPRTVPQCGIMEIVYSGGVGPYTLSVKTLLPLESPPAFEIIGEDLKLSEGSITGSTYFKVSAPWKSNMVVMLNDTGSNVLYENYTMSDPILVGASEDESCLDGSTPSAHYPLTSLPGIHAVKYIASDTSDSWRPTRGIWNSDNSSEDGRYEAYSNVYPEATFNCTGVAFVFYGALKSDRGLFSISVDSYNQSIGSSYYDSFLIDQYTSNTSAQPIQALWRSPLYPYGNLLVDIASAGNDSRINGGQGGQPYLVAGEWECLMPDDIEAYIATEVPGLSLAPATATWSPITVPAASYTSQLSLVSSTTSLPSSIASGSGTLVAQTATGAGATVLPQATGESGSTSGARRTGVEVMGKELAGAALVLGAMIAGGVGVFGL